MVKLWSTCLVVAMLLPSAARAEQEWGFISTAGDPDPVTVFDLADPGASNRSLGFVDGNFNRGMDFDTPNSFYYFVSTDTLNDPGDRGLWYFDGGSNTQLTTIGFSDSGDGDATLSNDGSKFFVSVSDGDATTGGARSLGMLGQDHPGVVEMSAPEGDRQSVGGVQVGSSASGHEDLGDVVESPADGVNVRGLAAAVGGLDVGPVIEQDRHGVATSPACRDVQGGLVQRAGAQLGIGAVAKKLAQRIVPRVPEVEHVMKRHGGS